MEQKTFSARFRRNHRKANPALSSPGSLPATKTVMDSNKAYSAPDDHAAPPVLTISTTSTPPQSSHSDHSIFHPPKSPFRNFHLRSSNKRARSPAPATLSQPTSPAVVKQNGTMSHEMMLPGSADAATVHDGVDEGFSGDNVTAQEQAKIPAFLAMSEPDIKAKYDDIHWSDVIRAASVPKLDPSFKPLDRYKNIQPWDSNRVRLQVPEGTSDYINASPIVIPSPLDTAQRPPHKYIAMQGPTDKTREHVWRMVAEQLVSPAVMVMLTETHEQNMEKCARYFPDKIDDTIDVGEDDEFGDGWSAQVKCVNIEEKANGAIEMRKLVLHVEDQDEDMVVWHMLYKKWPDFGVPALEDVDSFFELMQLSKDKNASDDNPRIVHCSAGVGRTGTFIALENLMREVDSGDLERYDEEHGPDAPDLVYDMVNALREQRRYMVQAELQYLFIYQVLRKQWMEKHGLEEDSGGEPAAKRLEVGQDPFIEDN